MQRFTDNTAIFPLLSISLSFAVITLFGATPIAQANDALVGTVLLATSSARSTLAEPTPTVLTRKNSLSTHAAPTVISDVQSHDDLYAYAASLFRDDKDITQIEFSPKRVTMTYRSQELVAGIGLRTVERTIAITDDGIIYVQRPWYTQGGGTIDAPESGFKDLALTRTAEGFTPETEARLLSRMQGRFAIGAL